MSLSRERRLRQPPLAGCSDMLGTHSQKLTGSNALQDGQEVGSQWLQIRMPVALRNEYHDRDVEAIDILLE